MSVTFLLRASAPALVRTQPAARIAATFWLAAEWVTCTDPASSVIVIGPRACSRSNSLTKLGFSPPICASAYRRAISASMAACSSRNGRQRLCSVGSGMRLPSTR